MSEQSILTAFVLTIIAGLCTGIGSTIAFFSQRTDIRFLALSLGFSAGVMLFVSLAEILPTANQELLDSTDTKAWVSTLGFFLGILIIGLIDKLVPSHENPHEARDISDDRDELNQKNQLMRMGILSALAIGIHNFPEGLATFFASLQDPKIGVSIAIAVALHNIPEGIAVSVPVYYATGSKKKAFVFSFASGLSEPLGALMGYLILIPFYTPFVSALILSMTAGIMVFIAVDELLPSAHKYGKHHLYIYSVVAGMAAIAISLMALKG